MNERRTSVPSEAAQLPVLAQFLQEFWSAASLPPAQSLPFEIALEEIFMNVVMHGTPAGVASRSSVCLALAGRQPDPGGRRRGPAVRPALAAGTGHQGAPRRAPVGGLGVYLVRQLMDAVSYARVGARNRLRMTKHLSR